MKILKICALTLLITTQAHAKLVVHEWGTFTSLVGSDGRAQNGMYQEDEVLPDFIHNFGETKVPQSLNVFAINPRDPEPQPTPPPEPPCRMRSKIPCDYLHGQTITQKMETPVVYFYADKTMKANFDVYFPGGIISQSYPAPLASLPKATPGVELKNGYAHYEFNILKDVSAFPPAVEATNIYSHARNVASDMIQAGNEFEKFIFYRGLGEFRTKLQITSQANHLSFVNSGMDVIPQVFLIYTDGKKNGSILSVGKMEPAETLTVHSKTIEQLKNTKQTQPLFLKNAKTQLTGDLIKAGLFKDEAKAMVDTWENGYFKTPGLRALYILGNKEVETILPIQIKPIPDELNRVFVGRIEIMLESDEEKFLNQIINEGRSFNTSYLGRLARPMLLRIREVAKIKGLLTDELAGTLDYLDSKIL